MPLTPMEVNVVTPKQAILTAEHLTIESRIVQLDGTTLCQTLVDDVSFTLEKGRVLGIVGESGSGKSLTARALMSILPIGIHLQGGQAQLDGQVIPMHDTKAMRAFRGKRMSMIFQDPLSSFNPLHRIGKQIREAYTQHCSCSQHELTQKIEKLLHRVGLEDTDRILSSFPHQLSGGQRQRAMLAMALISDPDVLIADEPTTALDAAIQSQIIALLQSLRNDVALIVISHDLGMMRILADDVCVMQKGKIVEYGTVQEVLYDPQHPYSKMLMQRNEGERPILIQKDSAVVLDIKNINVRYPLGSTWFWKKQKFFHAVKDVSFEVMQGECLGIVGESGSGKSSLGLAIARLVQSNGNVFLKKKNLNTLKSEELRKERKQIQMVFQDPLAALNPRLSVHQCIAEGLRAHEDISEKDITDKVVVALEHVDLDPSIRHRYPHEFSGGQCQRICIARALVMEPTCIIFDEPTSSLDRNTQFQVVNLIKKLQKNLSLACLFITHDLSLVRSLCNNVIVMHNGEVIEYESSENIFNNPQKEYTKLLLAAANAF